MYTQSNQAGLAVIGFPGSFFEEIFGGVVKWFYLHSMNEKDTQSVRISKDIVKELKINAATYGGTIRSLLERGAQYAMGENMHKSKKKNK